jgi:hypothetical protein
MIRLLAHPLPPLSHQQVVSLSQSFSVSPVELTNVRGGGGGAKPYEREKAWPSINLSIFSEMQAPTFRVFAAGQIAGHLFAR